MEVMEDHIHVFLSAPPRYAPARIAQILKSLSARELFARFPRLPPPALGRSILGRWLFRAFRWGCSDGGNHSSR